LKFIHFAETRLFANVLHIVGGVFLDET